MRRAIRITVKTLAILLLVAVLCITAFATYNRLNRFGPEDNPDWHLRNEAVAYAEKGEAFRSLVTARRIRFTPHNNYRDDAIKGVISALIRNDQDAEVIEFALSLKEYGAADSLLIDLAEAQAWEKKFDDAVTTLRLIEIAHNSGVGEGRVAMVLAWSGKIDEARFLARSIEKIDSRTFALNKVAQISWAQGDKNAAKDIINEVLTITRSIADVQSRSWILSDTAHSLAIIGDVGEALKLTEELPEGWQRESGLREISKIQAEAGAIGNATQTALLIANEPVRHSALENIMVILLEIGDVPRALAIANNVPAGPERNKLLAFASMSLLHRDRYRQNDVFIDIADTSLAVAKVAGASEWRDRAMQCIAYSGFANIDLQPALKAIFAIEDVEQRKETVRRGWRALLYGYDYCAPVR